MKILSHISDAEIRRRKMKKKLSEGTNVGVRLVY
jgi:hypothetical protein